MGVMKDLLITVYGGGDEAVAAVQRMGDDWREQLEQAAAEIERLRGYRDEAESDAAVARLLVDRLRLTDEERAEIEALADEMKTLEMCYGEDSLCQRQSDRYGAYARLLTAMLKRTE